MTRLVGKNESGKTTILKALHRLNPANGDSAKFDLATEYPRWKLSKDRKQNPDIAKPIPIKAEFIFGDGDLAALGAASLKPRRNGGFHMRQRRGLRGGFL